MKDLEWYKRQEKMDAIQYKFGLSKEWQETFIHEIKLLIPEMVNTHFIISDVWFDISNNMLMCPVSMVTIKCNDRIPMQYDPFHQHYAYYFNLLDMFKEYDEERKQEYLQHITREFKVTTSENVMTLIQFLNKIDNENKKEKEQKVNPFMWGDENGKTH